MISLGSLFSGYGGLELGVERILDDEVEVAWHAEIDPAACKVLAYRFPGVPNLGDISKVDWTAVAPIQVLTGGFPCQDVSSAGKRAGLRPGSTRTGLWAQMSYAISILQPRLVIAENVRGLLSADATSLLEPCPGCVGDEPDIHLLRALGAVLGDLATIGYDASWYGLRAADVGAPHGRFRVFIVAWPAADTHDLGPERSRSPWRWFTRPSHDDRATADTSRRILSSADTGSEEGSRLRLGADRHLPPAADASGARREHPRPVLAVQRATDLRGGAPADADGPGSRLESHGRGKPVTVGGDPRISASRPGQARNPRSDTAPRNTARRLTSSPLRGGSSASNGDDPGSVLTDQRTQDPLERYLAWRTAADTSRHGLDRSTQLDSRAPTGLDRTSRRHADGRGRDPLRGEDPAPADTTGADGRTDLGRVRRPDARRPRGPEEADDAAPPDTTGPTVREHTSGPPEEEAGTITGDRPRDPDRERPDIDWGPYLPAINRWEQLIGRPVPPPTAPVGKDGGHRLSGRFTEWLMGLPEGWVTDVPGITNNNALKLCGNGVVPQQAAAAVDLILRRRRALAVA